MVNPKIWGRPGWIFLISTVADYPDSPNIDMQYNYNRYFLHLKWTLPCEICRANYEQHFRKWPIDQYLKSRAALFRWIMIMYNEVQVSLNKKTKGPQELLYDLFGPEEGERMMQRLVYEDPDANITVIKPFDPTIDQYGGNVTTPGVSVTPSVTTITPSIVPIASPTAPVVPIVKKEVRTYPSVISNLQLETPSDSTSFNWINIMLLALLLLLAYYLFKK